MAQQRIIKLKVLFFTPHAALWAHTASEALLAKSLSEHGIEVSYLTCGRAMNYCAVMTSRRMPPGVSLAETAALCALCRRSAKRISTIYNFPLSEMADHISASELDDCAQRARDAVAARTLDTTLFGVLVGRLALYEFTLAHKKMSTELTDEQWVEYGIYLENSLISLVSMANYLKTHRPDAVVAYSPQYSNINPATQYALGQGIRVVFIENGTNIADRLGTMRIWDWAVHGLVNPALRYWKATELNRVTAASAGKVTSHFMQLLSGQHFAVFSPVYSGDAGLRSRWNVREDQRVVTITLSSYDEAYAALLIGGFPESKVFSDVFRTQAEWLRATIDWAAGRPDIFLVVRVHPRDFPNKREQRHSEQSVLLRDILATVPDNVHINWPAEDVSLYDLLDVTDVLTTGWSVTALEAMSLGIPVVTYDSNLPSYPADVMRTGRSAEAYFENLDLALAAGWDFANVVNGFRWMAYNFDTCTVPVSRALSLLEQPAKGPILKFWRRLRNKFDFIGQTIDLLGWRTAREGGRIFAEILLKGHDAIPPARSGHSAISADEEARTLTKELGTIHKILYPDDGKPHGFERGLGAKINRFLESAKH